MNQEALEDKIMEWEPNGVEVVRVIDSQEGTVERIVKHISRHGSDYSLFRYFTLGRPYQVHVSVDLDMVDADRVIQHLGERL